MSATTEGGHLPLSRWQAWRAAQRQSTYVLTRFAILRLLGLIYFVAFLTVIDQGSGLLGENGLTPIAHLVDSYDSHWQGFIERPSLLWLSASDGALLACGTLGLVLSLVVIAGYANGVVLLGLWILHTSIANLGQIWYAFGWEYQLLETGLLAVFLVPFVDGRPLSPRAPPRIAIYLFRWLTFRIMLGAGLIKLRGDACWEDLSCLAYHYETQPIPNPASPFFHALPSWVGGIGVAYNHFCELIVPIFVFGPRRLRHAAGLCLLVFQALLITSGNLSYLNWLTVIPILACFDDQALERLFPRRWRFVAQKRCRRADVGRRSLVASSLFAIIVAILSIRPIVNLASPHQRMNSSFDRLHLVNTYGAFGSVGKERYEIVFEGSHAESPSDGEWFEIEFRCKPGDPQRRPCQISPYHLRLDWLIWFAAMGPAHRSPWTYHLAYKILVGEPSVLSLLAPGPIHLKPPIWIRAHRYRYHLAPPFSDAFWTRELVGEWMRPIHLGDSELLDVLTAYGWDSSPPRIPSL